jgi:hypothetical protein
MGTKANNDSIHSLNLGGRMIGNQQDTLKTIFFQ